MLIKKRYRFGLGLNRFASIKFLITAYVKAGFRYGRTKLINVIIYIVAANVKTGNTDGLTARVVQKSSCAVKTLMGC